VDSGAETATRVDVSAREQVASGPSEMGAADLVEGALAGALAQAAAAGRWEVVETLARELGARRAAREARAPGAKVIAIDRHRRS
jgi:hypothetical protein